MLGPRSDHVRGGLGTRSERGPLAQHEGLNSVAGAALSQGQVQVS